MASAASVRHRLTGRPSNGIDRAIVVRVLRRRPRVASVAGALGCWGAWTGEAWTSTVWEEASERGFVMRLYVPRHGVFIGVTPAGRAFLREHGRPLRLSQQGDDFPGELRE